MVYFYIELNRFYQDIVTLIIRYLDKLLEKKHILFINIILIFLENE